MHRKLRILILLSYVVILSIGIIACFPSTKIVSTEHFVFELNMKKKYATAKKITDLGKEQEVLAIPSAVNSFPVRYIGSRPLLGDRMGALMLTNVQKKIYLPSSLNNRVGLAETSMMEAVLNKARPSEDLINSIKRFYEAELYYWAENTKLNTFFMYNFDSADNEGYYWMDYINGSNPYIIPSDPTRFGYEFAGWYYEQECLTSWNNEFPLSESESLTLYAKWI